MVGDVGKAIGDAFAALYLFAAVSVFVAWPLALWKLWDIGWWLWNNVQVTVKLPPYERGYAAALKAAAEVCENRALELFDAYKRGNSPHRANPHTEGMADAFDDAAQRILSLPIVGEADQRGAAAQQGPRNPGNGSTTDLPPCAATAQSAPHQNHGEPARPEPSQECVSVPREPKKGLLCGDVAISTDPRYAGWVFVRHVDGINWTTGAKLTPETWAMLAAREE